MGRPDASRRYLRNVHSRSDARRCALQTVFPGLPRTGWRAFRSVADMVDDEPQKHSRHQQDHQIFKFGYFCGCVMHDMQSVRFKVHEGVKA